MLDKLKSFDKDRLSVEELVELSAYARQLRAEYEALNTPEPEFIAIQTKTLRREITSRNADSLEAELRKIDARLATLQTTEEKREALKKQKEALTARLAGAS